MLAEGPGNSRLFVYMIGVFEQERRAICYGDVDLARVAEIIGAAGVEPCMRDAAFRAQHSSFDSVVGIEDQRAVNATSIAVSLGRGITRRVACPLTSVAQARCGRRPLEARTSATALSQPAMRSGPAGWVSSMPVSLRPEARAMVTRMPRALSRSTPER